MRALLSGIAGLLLVALASVAGAASVRKNLLYIISDDLRPQLGVYGHDFMITPNLDALAAESTVFRFAFAQVAVCCPSRSSFMTGRRPNVSFVYDNGGADFRKDGLDGDEWHTVPGFLKDSGWWTVGGGKTFHPNNPKDWDGNRSFDRQVRPYFDFSYFVKDRDCPSASKPVRIPGGQVSGIDTWCPIDTSAEPTNDRFYDATLANYTVNTLRLAAERFKAGRGPFAVYAGFARPHVPHRVPKSLFEHYYSTAPLANRTTIPEGLPELAYHRQGLYRYGSYDDPVDGWFLPNFTHVLPEEDQRIARAAYMASVTWMDMQVGRLLDELKEAGVANDTVIVFHGDHGWQLTESNMLHKETNLELGTRVPLIIHDPDSQAKGRITDYLAELVDVGRTVFDLVGAPVPTQEPKVAPFMGRSLRQAMENPEGPWPDQAGAAAFSQYPRCVRNNGKPEWMDDEIAHCSEDHGAAKMGYAVRTPQWRYIAWMNWNETSTLTDWSQKPYATELYNHEGDDGTDFSAFEGKNTAGDPANGPVLAKLHELVRSMYDTPNRE